METMKAEDVLVLKDKALREAAEAADLKGVEAVRIAYLGSKGLLKEIMQNLKTIEPGERPAFGQNANRLKTELMAFINQRKEAFRAAADQSGRGTRSPTTSAR